MYFPHELKISLIIGNVTVLLYIFILLFVPSVPALYEDRCLPDSEILWKTYHEFGISPMYILKDKEGIIHEVDALLEISEKECTEKILEIVSSLAEGNKE